PAKTCLLVQACLLIFHLSMNTSLVLLSDHMAPTSPTWRDGTYYSAESGTCCEVDLLSQPRAGGFSPTKSCRVPLSATPDVDAVGPNSFGAMPRSNASWTTPTTVQ
ncbi:hypothetical protein MCOR05_001720, partial [Pyricularia oryzae]